MNKILQEDVRQFVKEFHDIEQLRGRSIVVTGATGLLGSCFIRCLEELNRNDGANIRIIATVRNRDKAVQLFGEETDSLRYYIYDFYSDVPFCPHETASYIVHLASPTTSSFFAENPVETAWTIINGTRRIMEYARKCKPLAVAYISSLEVYGTIMDDDMTISENQQGYINPIEVRSSYPMAKRAAENLCHSYGKEYGVPVRILRLAQTFGAGVTFDDNRVFGQFARSVIRNQNIILHTTGELKRCYCYTIDAITAILSVMLKGENGEAYNVANEETYISIIDMAHYMCSNFNPRIKPIIMLKHGLGYSPVTKLRLSTQKIKQLGWQPQYDMRAMFERLILSMKEDITNEENIK